MKKMLTLLLGLFAFYYLVQIGFNYFSKGYEVEYTIKKADKEFKITETYTANIEGERDNYFINVDVEGSIFSLQVFDNFFKNKEILIDLDYYKDDKYECIFPVFKNEVAIFDVICMKDKVLYTYNSMSKYKELDDFVRNITHYNGGNFASVEKQDQELDQVFAYMNNYKSNEFVALSSYKGIYTINKKKNIVGNINTVKIFSQDKYTTPISAFVDKYYLIADYNNLKTFNMFYLVDITTNEKTEIKSEHTISLDSYIMGIVDKSIYLYDPVYKKEYEVDAEAKTVLEVGNFETGYKVLENGEWVKYDMNDMKKEKYFTNYKTTYENGNMIVHMGGEKSGHIYTLVKNNKKDYNYSVYRSNVQNPEQRLYLFEIDKFEDMIFVDDNIYFKNKEKVKVYNEKTGIKTLASYKELNYNKGVKFSGYIK